MKAWTFNRGLLLVAMCAVLTGCATSRSEIKLGAPAATPVAEVNPNAPVAVIRTIKDDRVFQQAPSEPNIPSLGFEGAAQASAEIRERAIGRKRNTYGKALGDVLLEKGQTVEGVVRENLAAGLRQAGFQVKTEKEAPDAPVTIDVSIGNFWAWFQPGFWAIKLHAEVSTNLKVNGASSPTRVAVQREESMQIATDSSWMEVIGKALESYRLEVAKVAAGFPRKKP